MLGGLQTAHACSVFLSTVRTVRTVRFLERFAMYHAGQLVKGPFLLASIPCAECAHRAELDILPSAVGAYLPHLETEVWHQKEQAHVHVYIEDCTIQDILVAQGFVYGWLCARGALPY